jgi:hypothetical protein
VQPLRSWSDEVEAMRPDLPHAFQPFDCGITKLRGGRLTEWFHVHLPG